MTIQTNFDHESAGDCGEGLIDLEWRKFLLEYPTEKSCLDELYKRLAAPIDACAECGSNDVQVQASNRVVRCKKCRKQFWLTAGTFFGHIRRPRAWLGALWLMDRGIFLSACRFHKLAGIAYASAFAIYKKISIVVEHHMRLESDIATIHFASLFRKRSRATPAFGHPRDENETYHSSMEPTALRHLFQSNSPNFHDPHSSEPQPDYRSEPRGDNSGQDGSEKGADDDELSEPRRTVFDCLSEIPLHPDSICARTGLSASHVMASLGMLEIEGRIEPALGGKFVRRPRQDLSDSMAVLDDRAVQAIERFSDFVISKFHGISRKYLQTYTALFWFVSDKKRWEAGSLLDACSRFRPIKYSEIRNYVSPPIVKIFCG